MSELEVLFHNPDSLDDRELRSVRNKMRMYKFINFAGLGAGVSLGLAFTRQRWALLPFGFAGAVVGNVFAKQYLASAPWALSQPNDKVILDAFTKRYILKTYNMALYTDNSLTAAQHTSVKKAQYQKPY